MPSNTKKKTLRNNMTRFLESYKADLSFGVTRGKRLPAKHFLLATGLRNITGSRTAINVLSHLGHYVDYDKTCQIETAQAIKTQKTANDRPLYLLSHEMRRVMHQPFSGQITLI